MDIYDMEKLDAYCRKYDEMLGWVQRGRFEGEKKGYAKGKKEGLLLGKKENQEEVILNMIDNNITLDIISKATKLSREEIEEIIKNSKRKEA